jgi:hypothetical protein
VLANGNNLGNSITPDTFVTRVLGVGYKSKHTPCIKSFSCNSNGTRTIQISTGVEDPRLLRWKDDVYATFFSFDDVSDKVNNFGDAWSTGTTFHCGSESNSSGISEYSGSGRMHLVRVYNGDNDGMVGAGAEGGRDHLRPIPVLWSEDPLMRMVSKNWLAFTDHEHTLFWIHSMYPRLIVLKTVSPKLAPRALPESFQTQLIVNMTAEDTVLGSVLPTNNRSPFEVHGSSNPVRIPGNHSGRGRPYLFTIVHLVSEDLTLNYASYAVALSPMFPFEIIGASKKELWLEKVPEEKHCARPGAFASGLQLNRSISGDIEVIITYGVCDQESRMTRFNLQSFEEEAMAWSKAKIKERGKDVL